MVCVEEARLALGWRPMQEKYEKLVKKHELLEYQVRGGVCVCLVCLFVCSSDISSGVACCESHPWNFETLKLPLLVLVPSRCACLLIVRCLSTSFSTLYQTLSTPFFFLFTLKQTKKAAAEVTRLKARLSLYEPPLNTKAAASVEAQTAVAEAQAKVLWYYDDTSMAATATATATTPAAAAGGSSGSSGGGVVGSGSSKTKKTREEMEEEQRRQQKAKRELAAALRREKRDKEEDVSSRFGGDQVLASEASKVGLLAAAVPSSVPSSVGKGVAVSELERGDEEDDEEDEEERGGDGDNGKSVGNSAQGAVGVAVGGGGGSAVKVVAAAASGNAGGGTTAATNSIKDKDKITANSNGKVKNTNDDDDKVAKLFSPEQRWGFLDEGLFSTMVELGVRRGALTVGGLLAAAGEAVQLRKRMLKEQVR
jgi:hypothetical protein